MKPLTLGISSQMTVDQSYSFRLPFIATELIAFTGYYSKNHLQDKPKAKERFA